MTATLVSSDPPSNRLVPGQAVAQYEIVSFLGAGGMGEVYLARDTRLRRNVALKILPAAVAVNQERMRRFEQEAKTAAGLNHPNIAQVYDIGEDSIPPNSEIIHFIVMEFVDGQTLKQHMARRSLEVVEVLDIAIQIAAAFVAAHTAGVVHRDIKPDNIMRRADGIVKVLDFGLAKLTDDSVLTVDLEAQTTPLTVPGGILGTFAYMSPEQARGKGVDQRSDIFSLGIVIYEMLTGISPFVGETPADRLTALLHSEPDSVTRYVPDMPSEFWRIIRKTLRKNRDERYENAKSLQNDLLDLKQDLQLESRRGAEAPARAPSTTALNGLHEKLMVAIRDGASSCTFYVRDPFWDDQLRLIAMPGVHIREPMHGFAFPPHSTKVVDTGPLEIFSAETRSQNELREDTSWPLDQIKPGQRPLFGDFVERENIRSSARLTWKQGNRTDAVMFVNFTQPTSFDDNLKNKLRQLLKDCVVNLEALREEIRASEIDDLIQAIRMFPPASDNAGTYELDLKSILAVAMSALELEPGTAFGTVHEYDPKSQTLQLVEFLGEIDEARAESQSIANGEGIISWVAIRRKALLISDLSRSEFSEIHIKISGDNNAETRSEVAIPIFTGESLVGVLNLESTKPNAFRPMCVRSLWLAVNRAAVAHRLSRTNQRIKYLLDSFRELCLDAIQSGDKFSLDRLAKLAVNELEAARCGIWRYAQLDQVFSLVGLDPSHETHGPPRPEGMSKFILRLFDELTALTLPPERSAWMVWITRAEAGDFQVRYWNGESWVQPPAHLKPPIEINPSVGPEVRSLLGIPITGRVSCIGVAWLEYECDLEASRVNDLMKLAAGFAGYAGLVIEFSQVDFVDKDQAQRIGGQLSNQLLASGPLAFDGFPYLEGWVISKPYPNSHIGGDFHAARVINDTTAAVLIGDGEGHAVTGALNMLPILTVFEAFWRDGRSATYLLDKIVSIAGKLGVRGTATYCVFSLIGQKLSLSAASAGHRYLVIIKKGGQTRPFPPLDSIKRGGLIGFLELRQGFVEDQTELSNGDLIIAFTDGFDLDVAQVAAVGLEHETDDPQTIAEAVFERAHRPSPLVDDATVLVLRVRI